eukprot:SAG31_NODE_50147_length_120_cov_10.428571_1_plen_25_part_10
MVIKLRIQAKFRYRGTTRAARECVS